jgi:hypothetical protein
MIKRSPLLKFWIIDYKLPVYEYDLRASPPLMPPCPQSTRSRRGMHLRGAQQRVPTVAHLCPDNGRCRFIIHTCGQQQNS